ncbi:unnamed protein product [Pleuronectes platessa]|uniref:Uncharacterized protein n=1 Tax=Pleuronectes platessa TaxID=8262 RepID=A0A9N7TGZ3_PLEPL|nr:unnamed protein product [Pleuronectes platessa]
MERDTGDNNGAQWENKPHTDVSHGSTPSNGTRAQLPDDFPDTWEITDSRQPLIQSEMGTQSCPLESLILLRQAATLGGDNKTGKAEPGTLVQTAQICFSQRLHAV